MRKFSFTPIKKALALHDRDALLGLLGDMYALSQQNRDFLDARFVESGSALDRYKKAIRAALFPNLMRDQLAKPRFRDASKAISDYRKALGEPRGVAELLVYAVECGTEFTRSWGDIDAGFYNALTNLFQTAANHVSDLDAVDAKPFIAQMDAVVGKANCVGWGFFDSISDIFREYFPDSEGEGEAAG